MNNSPEFQARLSNIGSAESIGKRSSMEDRSVVIERFMGDPNKKFFGLFDGHGGSKGAEIAAGNLSTHFHRAYYNEARLRQGKTVPQMLKEAFVLTDQDIENTDRSGTTAVVAYQDGQNITVANSGDSRAVLATQDGFRRITADNKATNDSGIFRVTRAGGIIRGSHLMMPNGQGLAVSRALGDREFRNVVIPDPKIYQATITRNYIALILACDGIWDVIPDIQAAQIVKAVPNPTVASRALVNEAYRRGSGDNLSAIVVKFPKSKPANIFSRIFS